MEASEDTEDENGRDGGDPDPASGGGRRGIKLNGIIAIALGCGLVAIAASVLRNRERDEGYEALLASTGGAATDPGDATP